jgi:ceramide glucosyltransferase
VLVAVVIGSLVYCWLVSIAAWKYLAAPLPAGALLKLAPAPISVLKPLHGVDEGLEANLASFFEQDYPEYEILLAVRSADDPAVAVVDALRRTYPNVPSKLIVTGEPPYPNAKVWSLDRMMQEARHSLLVMSDSDIRVTPECLKTIALEFLDPMLDIATCPYRAAPGESLWSRLEAIGMNTEFLGGVLVARMLEGMKFAVGPTIAARKETLEAIGGFDRLKDYLAEDFVMGKFAAEAGHGVGLSSYVIEHRIGSQDFASNARHRLRWCRSTRRSRPSGYAGQLFTNPLPLALMFAILSPALWMVPAGALLCRALAAWAVAGWVLKDPLTLGRWWLVPLQDMLSFAFWLAGFFGNTITWRGREYRLLADGRFEPIDR